MTSDSGKRDHNPFELDTDEADLPDEGVVPEAGFEPANDGTPSAFAEGEAVEEADAARSRELESENAELKDRLMRQQAEMENLRRRTEREMKDTRAYAISNFARDMLSVADNLRRALDAVPEEARAAGEGSLTGLIEGVEMTEKGLQDGLAKHGVARLEPEGQKFDPNFHQAMFEVPNTEVPNSTVVQVVQSGYAIGERVLRPAMVGVSKGGPKQPAAAAAADADATAGAGEAGPDTDDTESAGQPS